MGVGLSVTVTVTKLYDNPLWILTEKWGWTVALFLIDYGRHMNPVFMVRTDNGTPVCIDMVDARIEGDWSRDLPEPSFETKEDE